MNRANRHPRVNCCIKGCRRGSTRYPPDENGYPVEIICGPHWRQVPKLYRRRLSLIKRHFNKAYRIGNQEKALKATRTWLRMWDRCKALIETPDSIQVDGLPITMAEKLIQEGLI